MSYVALGAGGVAVALAITCVVLALRISGVKDALRAMDGARAEVKAQNTDLAYQNSQLVLERDRAVQEAGDVRRRLEKQNADLRRDVEQYREAHLRGANDDDLRARFDQFMGRK